MKICNGGDLDRAPAHEASRHAQPFCRDDVSFKAVAHEQRCIRTDADLLERDKERSLGWFDGPDVRGEDGSSEDRCDTACDQLGIPMGRRRPDVADYPDGSSLCDRANRTCCPSWHLANLVLCDRHCDRPL